MAKPRYLVNLLLLSLYSLQIISCHTKETNGMFVFGSSLVDNGNNNFLKTIAKADHLPYGLDSPHHQASGRFTNGRNFIDLLGENLKLPNIPVFYDPSTKGHKILHGVNYASGGSGILDDTGAVSGNVTSLNRQIQNFENVTLPDLRMRKINCSDYLFVIGSGGNDFSLNYFLGRSKLSLEAFVIRLISTLFNQIKKLYSLGARKFVIVAVYPNGCSPMIKARLPKVGGCIEPVNMAVNLYNLHLKNLITMTRLRMPSSNVVLFNAYNVMMDIIKSSSYSELSEKLVSCCEVNESGTLCKKEGSTCENRSKYVYFDGLHPTEAVNVVLANKAYSSKEPSDVYPINISQLSQI